MAKKKIRPVHPGFARAAIKLARKHGLSLTNAGKALTEAVRRAGLARRPKPK